jgi:hypothetical protein
MGASPNPFNPQTVVSFEVVATAVQQAVPVTLTVRDLAGREVLRLVDEVLPPGTYHQLWEGDDASGRKVASGVYLASLTIDGRLIGMQKLALIR